MLEDGRRAKAKLQTVSVTGGLLRLAGALGKGDFVEVAFATQIGAVRGMAEMPARAAQCRTAPTDRQYFAPASLPPTALSNSLRPSMSAKPTRQPPAGSGPGPAEASEERFSSA